MRIQRRALQFDPDLHAKIRAMSGSIEDARRVKEKVLATAGAELPIVGIGLTRVGADYAVKVNLESAAPTTRELPREIDGVQVIYEVVGRVIPRQP